MKLQGNNIKNIIVIKVKISKMESNSTISNVRKLLTWIGYAHHILPFYGFLNQAGYLMTLLSSKSSKLFHENIKIIRYVTFPSISNLRKMQITKDFNEGLAEFIISYKLYLYFTFDITLKSDKEIEDFKLYLLDRLPFIDQNMFKNLYFESFTVFKNKF